MLIDVTDGQTDQTCNRKTVLCTTVHRVVKQRRNTGIADIIGIVDIVLLSILSIDPALDDNTHLRARTHAPRGTTTLKCYPKRT